MRNLRQQLRRGVVVADRNGGSLAAIRAKHSNEIADRRLETVEMALSLHAARQSNPWLSLAQGSRRGGTLLPSRSKDGQNHVMESGMSVESTIQLQGTSMAHIDRRRLLKASSLGAMAAIFASGRAPAYAQGTSLQWLKFVDFVLVSDQLLRGKITEQCQKVLGIKLNIETIEGNGIQPRITSAIQSGTGPDIIMAINNWPQLYGDSVADVSDVAEEIGNAQGGYYETAKTVANDGSKWIAAPFTILGVLLTNRKSWWVEIGYNAENFPATWEEYVAAGEKLKPMGRPLGQTLGHTFGDAPAFWYPYLWSWGGKEVEADGKTVVLDTKETVESVKFMASAYKEAFDEGGFAWDDAATIVHSCRTPAVRPATAPRFIYWLEASPKPI
jgi:hypothetical protein